MKEIEKLVRHAFGGMKDTQGVPMADHCMRVANQFEPDTIEHTVGWLHDIIEDTKVDADYLAQFYDKDVVETVVLLTHDKKQMKYPEYIDRLCQSGNAVAIKVKLADQRDNRDIKRRIGMSSWKSKALDKKWAGVPEKLEEALKNAV